MSENNENLPDVANSNEMVVVNGKQMPVEMKEDFDVARANIIKMLKDGNDALVKLTEMAIDTEHPRVFEVVSTMMNTLSNLNKQLIELNKQKLEMMEGLKESKEPVKTVGDTNIENAVFIGSTKDLQEYLNNRKNGDVQ